MLNEVNFRNVLFIVIFLLLLGVLCVGVLNYTSFDNSSIFTDINNPNVND